MRWCKTEYADCLINTDTCFGSSTRILTNSLSPQGYELAEEEVKISLDRFRAEYTNDDGSPKYESLLPLAHHRSLSHD